MTDLNNGLPKEASPRERFQTEMLPRTIALLRTAIWSKLIAHSVGSGYANGTQGADGADHIVIEARQIVQ